MQGTKELDYLIQVVLDAMAAKKFSRKIIKDYRNSYTYLKQLAENCGINHLTKELLTEFQGNAINGRTGKHSRLKERHRIRCIRLLTSLAEKGVIDWSKKKAACISSKVTEASFHLALEDFVNQLKENGIKPNTVCGYKRIVAYFFMFCQEKGYTELQELQVNDITDFVTSLYRNGYFKPTTINGTLSGLRRFLSGNEHTKRFLLEVPVHLPRERKIIEVYDEQELSSIENLLSGSSLSKRDVAICRLLLETGLRGIDVCGIKLSDIDWHKDVIYIVQNKTGEPLSIPLKSSYGNAIADYILTERPESSSEHLFLRSFAPYEKLGGAGAIYEILDKMEEKAAVRKEGRIIGSRMTRHNAASSMLRSGVPMSDISAALGHKDPNTVLVYISTDEKTLSACTLALPATRNGGF
jgi:site-specific recombinase XerD